MVIIGMPPSLGPLSSSSPAASTYAGRAALGLDVARARAGGAARPCHSVDAMRSQISMLSGQKPSWHAGGPGIYGSTHVTPWKTGPVVLQRHGQNAEEELALSPATVTGTRVANEEAAMARRQNMSVSNKIGAYHQQEGSAALRQIPRIPALQWSKATVSGFALPKVQPSARCSALAVLPAAEVKPTPPPFPGGGDSATSGGATSGGAISGGATSGGATSGGATGSGATGGGAKGGGAAGGGASGGVCVVGGEAAAAPSIEVAAPECDGRVGLQRVPKGAFIAATHAAASNREARAARRQQAKVVVRPPSYAKKKAGVLSTLLRVQSRTGRLLQEPPREVFFEAW